MYEEIEEGDVEVGRKSNLWLSDMLQKIHFLLSKLKLAKGRLIVPETEPTLEAKKGKSGTISRKKRSTNNTRLGKIMLMIFKE